MKISILEIETLFQIWKLCWKSKFLSMFGVPIWEIETSILEIILRKSLLEMAVLILRVTTLILKISLGIKIDLKVQKSYNILEISVLSWVIKNFILIVKRCFQSFHFHLSTWEERIQFFVLEIRTWFYFYNNCLGS